MGEIGNLLGVGAGTSSPDRNGQQAQEGQLGQVGRCCSTLPAVPRNRPKVGDHIERSGDQQRRAAFAEVAETGEEIAENALPDAQEGESGHDRDDDSGFLVARVEQSSSSRRATTARPRRATPAITPYDNARRATWRCGLRAFIEMRSARAVRCVVREDDDHAAPTVVVERLLPVVRSEERYEVCGSGP